MHRSSRSVAQDRLDQAVRAHQIDACTFYVRDPLWSDHFRLLLMPGVQIPEAVLGFQAPLQSERQEMPDKTEAFLTDASRDELRRGISDQARKLLPQNRLFGDFIIRENIVSRAWFLHRNGEDVDAILTLNYRHAKGWDEAERQALRRLFHDGLLPLLPEIIRDLQEEAGHSVRRLTRILEATRQLISLTHPEHGPSHRECFLAILRAAFEAFDLHKQEGCGTIHLLQPDRRTLHLEALYGDFKRDVKRVLCIDRGEGVTSWVALRQQPILINHLASSPFKAIYVEYMPSIQSELAVPMLAGKELLGVLNLECTRPQAFDWESVCFLSYAATQAAIGYRLVEQARLAEQHANLTRDMLHICSDAPLLAHQESGHRPLDDLAFLATRFLGVQDSDIWQYDATSGQFNCVGVTFEKKFETLGRPRPSGWSHYVQRMQRPVWIHKTEALDQFAALVRTNDGPDWVHPPPDDRPPTGISQRLLDLDIGSELGLPIRLGSECLGVAWFKCAEKTLDVPQLECLVQSARGFAGQAALVLWCLREVQRQQNVSKLDAMSVLINSITHEVGGKILQHVQYEIEQTQDGPAFLARKKSWEHLLEYLLTYVEHLKWFRSGPEPGKNPIEACKERFDLRSLVDTAIGIITSLLPGKPACENQVPAELQMLADEKLVTHLLANVLHNAKKYTNSDRRHLPIVVSAKRLTEPPSVRVAVDDQTGAPITPDEKDRLGKEVGLHINRAGKPSPGIGFGLYLCGLIVDAHGGRMVIEPSARGPAGTCFVFYFPIVES